MASNALRAMRLAKPVMRITKNQLIARTVGAAVLVIMTNAFNAHRVVASPMIDGYSASESLRIQRQLRVVRFDSVWVRKQGGLVIISYLRSKYKAKKRHKTGDLPYRENTNSLTGLSHAAPTFRPMKCKIRDIVLNIACRQSEWARKSIDHSVSKRREGQRNARDMNLPLSPSLDNPILDDRHSFIFNMLGHGGICWTCKFTLLGLPMRSSSCLKHVAAEIGLAMMTVVSRRCLWQWWRE